MVPPCADGLSSVEPEAGRGWAVNKRMLCISRGHDPQFAPEQRRQSCRGKKYRGRQQGNTVEGNCVGERRRREPDQGSISSGSIPSFGARGPRTVNVDAILLSAVREGAPMNLLWAFPIAIDLNSSKDSKPVSREIPGDGPRRPRHVPSKCRPIARNSRAIYRELFRMVRRFCNRWRP